jgi:hypothetical protein
MSSFLYPAKCASGFAHTYAKYLLSTRGIPSKLTDASSRDDSAWAESDAISIRPRAEDRSARIMGPPPGRRRAVYTAATWKLEIRPLIVSVRSFSSKRVGRTLVSPRRCEKRPCGDGDVFPRFPAGNPGASVRARRTSRVHAVFLLLAVVLLLPAPARAIHCSQWTRLSYEQKIDFINQMTEDALGGHQVRQTGVDRLKISRCMQDNAENLVDEFDYLCAQGQSVSMDALNRRFKDYAWSCVR